MRTNSGSAFETAIKNAELSDFDSKFGTCQQ